MDIKTGIRSQESQADTSKMLGELIWWRLDSALVPADGVRNLVSSLGLPLSAVPKKVRLRTQLSRSLDELADDGFVRRIVEDRERAVFVMVGEDIDQANETASYGVEERFTYDKKLARITCDRPSTQVRVDALIKKYEGCFTKSDINLIICRMIDSEMINGIALRRGSGIYFTPAASVTAANNLSSFIENVTGGGEMSRMFIPSTSDNRKEVNTSYLEDFKLEIDRTKLKLESLKEADSYRKSTMVKEMEELLRFSSKSRVYSQMLEIDRADMNKQIDEVETMIREMMLAR